MISREVFFGELETVADILGRKIDTRITTQYYDMLKDRYYDTQWKRICSAAKMECKMFPRPSELIAIGEQMGFALKSRRTGVIDSYYSIECRCGETWVEEREQIDREPTGRTICPECEHVYKWGNISSHHIGGFFSGHADWRPLWDGTARYDPVAIKDLFTKMAVKKGSDQAARDEAFRQKQGEMRQLQLTLEEEKQHGDAFDG